MAEVPRKKNSSQPSAFFRTRFGGCLKKLRAIVLKGLVGFVLLSLIAVVSLRWLNPLTSAYMLLSRFPLGNGTDIRYTWVNMEQIAPVVYIAVVAAEDQKFPRHNGFDYDSISDAIEDRLEGHRIRGASTISQQVAKNLFLWPSQSFFRKGVEAYFTVLIETLWSKKRILEIYLNIAEFGEGTFGVLAAAQRYFHKPPSSLSSREAALLAAVLPNPKRLKVYMPSAYVYSRVRWIESHMAKLGGPAYLNPITREK